MQQATTKPHLCWRLSDTHGQVGASEGSLLLSPGSWCTQDFVCAFQESVSPVLCKFWWLYGRVNGDLLPEGLCHTQVCCTQSTCPCGRPLLTHTSTGDTQALKGRSGSVSVGSTGMHKVLFEPSEHLWWAWALIIKMIPPLLPSFGGFSFALGCGVSFFGGIQKHFFKDTKKARPEFLLIPWKKSFELDKLFSFFTFHLEIISNLQKNCKNRKKQKKANTPIPNTQIILLYYYHFTHLFCHLFSFSLPLMFIYIQHI